jgi:subtilisin family serine protease
MNQSISHRILKMIEAAVLALFLVASSWSSHPVLAQPATTQDRPKALLDPVEQAIQADGTTQVVVALRLPYASSAVGARKAQVAQAQSRVLQALAAPDDFQVTRRYQTVPGLVGVVTPQGLESLRHSPDVQAVALDMPIQALDSESAALIQADRVWNDLGLTGAGVNVAVIDTGVDRTHPDLADHIVAQHCFSKGSCPPSGADEGEDAQDENGHGTHVAGIITSRGTASPRGIAPDAGLVAVRVMDKNASGWNSDMIAGIDWVVANQAQFNIKALNLSLGAGQYADACDAQDANTMLQAAALEAARQAGIVTFAASGNEGLTNEMVAPACISSVVSVGAVYDANLGATTWPPCSDANATTDQVACFSNSSSTLDLLAPGAVIVSTMMGGGQVSKSGTSMASPHATAAAALMLQAYPSLTPAEIETTLERTGIPITDYRTGRTTPRIDALAAVTRVISDHVAASIGVVPANLRLAIGTTATTTLQVDAMRDLYSLDWRLAFDSNLVQVVDADRSTSGVQIAVGTLMSGRDYVVTRNQVDNTTGVVEFGVALRAPASPINGSGAVAIITWQGKGVGQSAIAFQHSQLASPGGSVIPHTIRNGAIQISAGSISGVVLLQGRTNQRDTIVYLTKEPCAVRPAQVITPSVPSAVTDAQGHFEIVPEPGINPQCLQTLRSGYLVGQKSAPQGHVGTITLPGGDVTADDTINIFDLALVASQYGSSDPLTDVNADGIVNIFDLTLVASNFGKSGPITTWH